MVSLNRRQFIQGTGAAVGTALIGTSAASADTPVQSDSHSSDESFVGTWAASPVPPGESGYTCTGFQDQTLRQIIHTSIGGSQARLRLSNTFGSQPITFDQVAIGVRKEGATVVSDTNTTVTFGGEQTVMIPQGALAYSDPIPLSVEEEQDLVISLYTSDATGPATWHPLALQTSYLASGNAAGQTTGEDYQPELMSWYFLAGVDVVPMDDSTSAIVTLGDSITDGYASTPDTNHRYPNYLAQRLNDQSNIDRSVLNAGISGNRILHDSLSEGSFGTNALERLNRDVIAQPGATDVIVLEGINDIGQYPPSVSAEQIIQGLKQIATQCHAHGLNVYAGTLTPTRGTGERYSSPTGEAKREMVNEFIRSNEYFDDVIDFDAAIQDPDQPDRMDPDFDSGDHLHPNDAGYEAMADAIDLSLFE